MRLRHGGMIPLLVFLVAIGASGCAQPEVEADPTPTTTKPTPTPTPAPEPTRPALAELVLTADGLGTLRIGGPLPDTADPETAMVAWDPEVCVNEDYGIGPGDPLAGGYRTDPSYLTGSGLDPFYIGIHGDVLTRIDVRTPGIPTDGGLVVGDARSAILTAHPDATYALDRFGYSEVYQVTGTQGILLIEASTDPGDGYWSAEEVDKVIALIVVPIGTEPFGISGSDNSVFGCSYT